MVTNYYNEVKERESSTIIRYKHTSKSRVNTETKTRKIREKTINQTGKIAGIGVIPVYHVPGAKPLSLLNLENPNVTMCIVEILNVFVSN